MVIKTTGLIYFSPTQTTRKVVEGIAHGIHATHEHHFDLTLPAATPRACQEVTQDLAIIGAPVYVGRLPSLMVSRLKQIKGNGTPAVIVVVYGNRAYEDALLELRDISLEAGFTPIAAGAFIGEHSYSTTDLPIAAGRPDIDDMVTANAFGKQCREKLLATGGTQSDLLHVPGNFPYKEIPLLPDIAPSVNETLCSRCGRCVPVCPTAAINPDNPLWTEKGLCLRCCACVKVCPATAKAMDDPHIRHVAEWLHANFRNRKEPETFV